MTELDFLKTLRNTDAALPPLECPVREDSALDRAIALALQHDGVVGAGLGAGGQLKVYLSHSRHLAQLPDVIGGFSTAAEVTGLARAY